MLLFIAVFGALLVTATFTDLQVSNILTAKALAAHTYYTNETVYGVVLEAVGSSPVYLMLAFSFQILFWQVMRKMKKHPWKEILAILLLVAGTAAYFVMFDDAVKYALQHIGPEAELFRKAAFLRGISMFFAGLMTFFATFAIRNYSEESVNKMVMFAVAVLCVAALSNGLVAAVKGPVGRMRYRAMNCEGGQSIGGFDNFTRWYVANGQHLTKDEMRALKAGGDLLGSVLEPLQGANLALVDDDVVPEHPDLGISRDLAVLDHAAGDGADGADLVGHADLGVADDGLLELGRQHALHSGLDLVNGVVDDPVEPHIHVGPLAVGLGGGVGTDVEAHDNRACGGGQQNVAFVDGAHPRVNDPNPDFLVGNLLQGGLHGLGGALYVGLDDQGQLLHFALLHPGKEIVQSNFLGKLRFRVLFGLTALLHRHVELVAIFARQFSKRMEKEEGHLRCYAADGINIVHQIGMLMREILRQRGNEALCRGSNIVSGSILGHIYAVGTVQWHWLCFEAVDDTKITEQTMHVPAGVQPSDNVHSGVEHSTEAAERHQSATNHRILLDRTCLGKSHPDLHHPRKYYHQSAGQIQESEFHPPAYQCP